MVHLFDASARIPAKHNLWVFCPEIPDFGQETRLNDVRIDALVEKITYLLPQWAAKIALSRSPHF
jgi:hypothetical protein